MADHMWFVPVTGGARREIETVLRPGFGGTDDTNVQWDFSAFPVLQQPRVEIACLTMSSFTTFIPGVEGATVGTLRQCYGSWSWRSCAGDDPLRIITGGQLMVGTVFSRELPTANGLPPQPTVSWATADAWVKFRVRAANMNVLNAIYLNINDSGANFTPPVNLIGAGWPRLNTWEVAYVTNSIWTSPNWDNDNLRVTIDFEGTVFPANVGLVTVDVEWFAIRLRTET